MFSFSFIRSFTNNLYNYEEKLKLLNLAKMWAFSRYTYPVRYSDRFKIIDAHHWWHPWRVSTPEHCRFRTIMWKDLGPKPVMRVQARLSAGAQSWRRRVERGRNISSAWSTCMPSLSRRTLLSSGLAWNRFPFQQCSGSVIAWFPGSGSEIINYESIYLIGPNIYIRY